MSLKDLPTSVWSGTLQMFGVDLKCHVLSDGQRVIEADSMHELMAQMADPDGLGPDLSTAPEDMDKYICWMRGGSIDG